MFSMRIYHDYHIACTFFCLFLLSSLSLVSALHDHTCLIRESFVTWDGSSIRACMPRICDWKYSVPAPPPLGERRATEQEVENFNSKHKDGIITGWMDQVQVDVTRSLTQYQHSQGIRGTVGEIGLHNGLYFICLAIFSQRTEPLLAIDLFPADASGTQTLDGSGRGSSSNVINNLKQVNLNQSEVRFVIGDSTKLNASSIFGLGLPPIRFLSVDGGHSLEIALRDMNLAACLLADGGVMSVDDAFNWGWPGVFQAVVLFTQSQDRLAPFLYVGNKMFFTTPNHHSKMLQLSEQKRWGKNGCRSGFHESRETLGKWPVCYVDN